MKKFSFFSKFFEKLKNIGKKVKDAVMKKMGPVFEYIKNTLKGIRRITKTIYKLIKKFIISPIVKAIKSVANTIRSAISFFFKMLGNLSRLFFNAIKSGFKRIGDFIKNTAKRLNDFLRKKCKWYDKAINKINNVKNFIKSKL
jgi:phage-related protein